MGIHKLCFRLFLLGILVSVVSSATDLTMVAKTSGMDVMTAVLTKIQGAKLSPEDYSDFLRRLAFVQANFGDDSSTYGSVPSGGMWQISEDHYKATKGAASLTEAYKEIQAKLSIDWNLSSFSDLDKPMYSGLAAQLYIMVLSSTDPLPSLIIDQAEYWSRNFKSASSSYTPNIFIQLAKKLDKNSSCKSKLDLVVVLDESGSVTQANFDLALKFVADFFASFNLKDVREGYITFDHLTRVIFELDNTYTAPEIHDIVNKTVYHGGTTGTDAAILKAAELFTSPTLTQRPGVPRVMTVITDGGSDYGVVAGMQAVAAAGVTSYAIGVGSGINQVELAEIAQNDKTRVFTIADFGDLTEFFRRLNRDICGVSQNPGTNTTTSDMLDQKQRRDYVFTATDCVLIKIDNMAGNTTGYFSVASSNGQKPFTTTPTSALNDGIIKAGDNFINNPLIPGDDKWESIYVSIEGVANLNNYTITTTPVSCAGAPTTTTTDMPTMTTTPMGTGTTVTPPPQQNCPAVSGRIQCYLNSLEIHVQKIQMYMEEIRAANPNPTCNCPATN